MIVVGVVSGVLFGYVLGATVMMWAMKKTGYRKFCTQQEHIASLQLYMDKFAAEYGTGKDERFGIVTDIWPAGVLAGVGTAINILTGTLVP